MYNPEHSHLTISELRNALTGLRTAGADASQININAFELVLSHALVDMMAATDMIASLGEQLEQARGMLADIEKQAQEKLTKPKTRTPRGAKKQ